MSYRTFLISLATISALLWSACAPAAEGPSKEGVASKEEVAQAAKNFQDLFPINPPEPAKKPKYGGTLYGASSYDPAHLDPRLSSAGGVFQITNMVYNKMLKYKHGPEFHPFNLEIIPDLAKSWEVSKDGLNYTFKLNEGVKWQNLSPVNGRSFTSEDVKYAWEAYAKEGLEKGTFADVDKIETPDPLTVTVALKQPSNLFLNRIASPYIPIFPKEILEQDGDLKKRAVGTGPYILKELTKKEKIVVEKNPNYFKKGYPYIDGAVFYIMEDIATKMAAYNSRQVDVVNYLPSAADALEMKKAAENEIRYVPPTSGSQVFAMRLDKAPFNDVRFRRAVSMATNRQAMLDTCYEGAGYIGPSLPWSFVLDKAPKLEELGPWWQYNLEAAKKLMAEAGYTPEKPLKVTMPYYPYNEGIGCSAAIAQEDWKKIGLETDVQRMDYTTYNNQLIGRTFDTMIVGWQVAGQELDTFLYGQMHSKSPANRFHINDPVIDQLTEQQRRELDPVKRKAIAKQISDRDLDQVFRIMQPGAGSFYVNRNTVRNYRNGQWVSHLFYSSYQMEILWLDK